MKNQREMWNFLTILERIREDPQNKKSLLTYHQKAFLIGSRWCCKKYALPKNKNVNFLIINYLPVLPAATYSS
ncbi:hypothetical protein [Mucilaginibacter sp. HD30]